MQHGRPQAAARSPSVSQWEVLGGEHVLPVYGAAMEPSAIRVRYGRDRGLVGEPSSEMHRNLTTLHHRTLRLERS